MNVQKVLEEIKEIEKKFVIGHEVLFALGATGIATEIEETIRSHMNHNGDDTEMDSWIPVSERLPEVPEGTEDDDCPEFNVTIRGAEKATTLKYAPDGTWFDDSGEVYNVIAWQLLPEVYKGGE